MKELCYGIIHYNLCERRYENLKEENDYLYLVVIYSHYK